MNTPLQHADPRAAPSRDALVLAEQAQAVQANVPELVLGNALLSSLVALVLYAGAPLGWMLAWLVAQWLLSASSWQRDRRIRTRPATAHNAARRLRAITLGNGMAGLLWMVGVALHWPSGDLQGQWLLSLLVLGLVPGALHALHGWLPAFYAFFLPCMAGLLAVTVREGTATSLVFAATAVLFTLSIVRIGWRANAALLASIGARLDVAELAARLQVEKDRAEDANQAKSRFLAAASHDLRQPVHALTLLVDALAAQPGGPEAEHMLSRISATVAGMGDMFNALLDVSKLDAGMVAVQAQTFELRTLLERLCAEQATVAARRGLHLRLNARAVRVHTDPLLLERIVRNLLVNALRYTESGGVLVTARQRGGSAVLRVADSGIGIAPQRQDEVFAEFVQLHNPQRDRNQGLGLGLAIVRRLVRLLDIDLSLRSRPGHGSVFTLRLTVADTAAAAAPLPAASIPATMAGDSALVLVIDDDADIRTGMRTLLATDGYRVLDAAGFDELRPQLRQLRQVPVLIISDYRLREGEIGAAAIERLRVEFNVDIPAILITGDTAPERLREARDSGHLLLHKPVPPQLLRQRIAALLAAPGVAG